MKFIDLPLIWPIQKALEKLEFVEATPIQELVIPIAINKRDILWSAQTWSWKTLAFVLPILQNLYNARAELNLPDWKINRKIQALILAPTRELAIQIGETMKPYATNSNMKYAVIYGWVNQFHQVKSIEKWIDILIATPWRLEDLISQWLMKLSYVEILTIDEADRMLHLGSLPDIRKILKRLPTTRQTFLFSATIPTEIKKFAQTLLTNPETITVKWPAKTTTTVEQEVYHIKSGNKRALLQQIVKRPDLDSIIVFVRTMEDTEYVLEYVKTAWVKCDSIHKKKTQNSRQKALNMLKSWEIKVLVATDIAARWLDIEELSCVLNWNIPLNPDDYIHRIGRTARAGREWLAISMCMEVEKTKFEAIEKLVGKKITVNYDDSYLKEDVSAIVWLKPKPTAKSIWRRPTKKDDKPEAQTRFKKPSEDYKATKPKKTFDKFESNAKPSRTKSSETKFGKPKSGTSKFTQSKKNNSFVGGSKPMNNSRASKPKGKR